MQDFPPALLAMGGSGQQRTRVMIVNDPGGDPLVSKRNPEGSGGIRVQRSESWDRRAAIDRKHVLTAALNRAKD